MEAGAFRLDLSLVLRNRRIFLRLFGGFSGEMALLKRRLDT